jgi:hypothetical protein
LPAITSCAVAGLLVPWRNPIFPVHPHKIGLLVPYALLALFISNLFIVRGFYALTFSLQIVWYAFASVGYLLTRPLGPEPVLTEDLAEVVSPVLVGETKRAA